MKRALLLASVALVGCTLPFPDVPEGATLSCEVDSECPDDFRCDGQRCVQAGSACGDGFVAVDEACDDGNENPADGCDLCRLVTWRSDLAIGRRVERRGPLEFPLAPAAISMTPDGNVLFTVTSEEGPGAFLWDRRLDLVVPIAGIGGKRDFEAVAELEVLATLVPLKVPLGIAGDLDGTVWLTDAFIPRLMRIDPTTRILSSAAGSGVIELDEDDLVAPDNSLEVPAVAARFSFPNALILDAVGRPHVIDSDARSRTVIKRLDPDGFVRRIAGSFDAKELGDGGPATDAKLDQIAFMVFDDEGALYTASLRSGRIRRIDPDGTITTFVGGGDVPVEDRLSRTDASLSFLRGLVFHQGAIHFINSTSLYRVEGDVVRKVRTELLVPPGAGVRMTSDGDTVLLASGSSAAIRIGDVSQAPVLGGANIDLPTPLAMATDFRLGSHHIAALDDVVLLTYGGGFFRIEDRLVEDFTGAGVKDIAITPDGSIWFATADAVFRRTELGDERVVGALDDESPPPEDATLASDVTIPRSGELHLAVRGDELFLSIGGEVSPAPRPAMIYRVDRLTGAIAPVAGGAAVLVDGGPAIGTDIGAVAGLAATRDALVYASGGRLLEIADGVITERLFHDRVITALTSDDDDLYFADNLIGIATVFRLRPGGLPEPLLGGHLRNQAGDGGAAIDASTSFVADVDIDGDRLYISAQGRVRRVDLTTGRVTSIAGTVFPDDGDLDDVRVRQPGGLLVSRGALLVTDAARRSVRQVRGGTLRTVIGYPERLEDDEPGGDGLFSRLLRQPRGMATVDGEVWIAEAVGSLRVISGDLTTARTRLDTGLVRPTSLTWDEARRLVYIADPGAHVVRALSLDDDSLRLVAGVEGLPSFTGDGDLAATARLNTPTAVLLSPPSDLFIADTNNHRVRRVDLDTGVIDTVLGIGVGSSFGEGTATELPVDAPAGLFMDPHDNLYVSSRTTVRQVSAGQVRTIYGAERDTFPEALTECLGDITALDGDTRQLVVVDRCAGYVVELTRSVE